MARYRYKPYQGRRGRNKNRAFFILALIVIVIMIFTLSKCRNGDEEPIAPKDIEDAAAVEMIEETGPEPLPEPEPEPEPLPKPEETVEPEDKGGQGELSDSTDSRARALIDEALGDITAGQIIAARDKLVQALPMKLGGKMLAMVKAQLTELSKKWLFSKVTYQGDTLTGIYEVQRGDLLSNVARRYKVPYESLMMINGIKDARRLRAGDKIKIINGPFHAIVYRSTFTMDLYLGSKTYVKTYKVGLGKAGKETPTGKWRVKVDGKLIKPDWTDPETGRRYIADDPDYPLGSCWISLEGLEGNAKGRTGFAIHGTKDPQTIGTRSSLGCIRLHNGQATEVFNLLATGLSEVRVVD